VTAPANLVSIGNYTIETGATIRVPIYLNNSDNISGVGIKMTFDPAVVNVTSLDPVYPENESGFFPEYSQEDVGNFRLFYGPDTSSPGVITINTFKNGSGLNGSQVIGYVRMRAVGSAGNYSPLNISVLAMGDGEAKDVGTYGVENGSVTLSGIPDILSYYRGLRGEPDIVDTRELLMAADDWGDDIVPPGFDKAITTQELLRLADEWANS